MTASYLWVAFAVWVVLMIAVVAFLWAFGDQRREFNQGQLHEGARMADQPRGDVTPFAVCDVRSIDAQRALRPRSTDVFINATGDGAAVADAVLKRLHEKAEERPRSTDTDFTPHVDRVLDMSMRPRRNEEGA